jgi:hypothetical protein
LNFSVQFISFILNNRDAFVFLIRADRQFFQISFKCLFEGSLLQVDQDYEQYDAKTDLTDAKYPLESLHIFCVFLANEIVKDLIEKVLSERIKHGIYNKLSIINCAQLLSSGHKACNSKYYHVHEVTNEVENQSKTLKDTLCILSLKETY